MSKTFQPADFQPADKAIPTIDGPMTAGAVGGSAARSWKRVYALIAFFLLVANLRPALTSVGPMLASIRSDLGLSGTAAGLLPTLPLLIFAIFSPLSHLGRVFGIERTLAGCLALIAAGIALRSQGSSAALFGGTAIFATGIGVANVLIPSVIKRDFPQRVGAMTTAYIMAMTVAGAVATGLAVPLASHLPGGWRSSLAAWAVFAVFTLFCWLPETRKSDAPIAAAPLQESTPAKPIWRSALAWQVTLFMGLQFLIYYVAITWIPLFLFDHGVSRAEAGWLLSLYQMMTLAIGTVAPALLRSGRDQRPLAVVGSLITALSILGLTLAPSLAVWWLTLCGGSFGVTFILAFALIGMRTSDHLRAGSLSAIAQANAYLIAAAGPVAFGWIHDLTTSWTIPMAGLLMIALIQALAGLGAGRNRQV
jgi:CP family cyanate transporter-like MFS transporter